MKKYIKHLLVNLRVATHAQRDVFAHLVHGVVPIIRIRHHQPENVMIEHYMPRWIPVAERRPEDEQEVLCTDGCCIYEATYDVGSFTDNCITHWMPMLELPEEDNYHD